MRRAGIGIFLASMFLCSTVSLCTAANGGGAAPSSVTPQVKELQEKMLGDEGVMALIMALQNDPEMQALLNDPAVVEAVKAGDIGVLANNPRFMNLLNKPQVREIQRKVAP